MSDCFSIKHSKYISSFWLWFILSGCLAVIANEGYRKGDCSLPACLAGYYPPSALNDNEGLTLLHTASLAPCTSYLAHSSEVKLSQRRPQTTKGRESEGIGGSALDLGMSAGDGRTEERGEKQWLTGVTGERIFTKLDINCSALHLRQGTCKVP